MTTTSSVMSPVDYTQDLIPIATLNPSQPPPSSTIHAEVSLIWPYSSSTKRAALLLGEPDFRARRNKGQVRVQLRGPAAEAVAASHISIGDLVHINLEGASWSEERSAVGVPGRHVDGELLFDHKIRLKITRNRADFGTIDVNDPVSRSPPRNASPPASELPLDDSAATPSATVARSSPAFIRQKEALLRSAVRPAFFPRPDLLALSTNELIDVELDNEKPRKRTKFGRKTGEWTFRREEEHEDLDTTEHDTMGSFDVELLDREIREEEVREKQALLRRSPRRHRVVSPGLTDFGLDGSAASRPYVPPEQFDQIIEESLFGAGRRSPRRERAVPKSLHASTAEEVEHNNQANLVSLQNTSNKQKSDTQLAIDRQIMAEQQVEPTEDDVDEVNGAIDDDHDVNDGQSTREEVDPEASKFLEEGVVRRLEMETRDNEVGLAEPEHVEDEVVQQQNDDSENAALARVFEHPEPTAKPDLDGVKQEIVALEHVDQDSGDEEQEAAQVRDDDHSMTVEGKPERDKPAQEQARTDLQIPAVEEISGRQQRSKISDIDAQPASSEDTFEEEYNVRAQMRTGERQAEHKDELDDDQHSLESDSEDDEDDHEEDDEYDSVQEFSQAEVIEHEHEQDTLKQDAATAEDDQLQEQSVLDENVDQTGDAQSVEVEDDSMAVELDDTRLEAVNYVQSRSPESSPVPKQQEVEEAEDSHSRPSSPVAMDDDDDNDDREITSRTEQPSESQLEALQGTSTVDVIDTLMVVEDSDSRMKDASHAAYQGLNSSRIEETEDLKDESTESREEDLQQISPTVLDYKADGDAVAEDEYEPPQEHIPREEPTRELDDASMFVELHDSTVEDANRAAYPELEPPNVEDIAEDEVDEGGEPHTKQMSSADEGTVLQEVSSQLQASQHEPVYEAEDASISTEVNNRDPEHASHIADEGASSSPDGDAIEEGIDEDPMPQVQQDSPVVIEDDSPSPATVNEVDEDVVMAEDTSLMREETSLMRAHRPRSSSVEVEELEEHTHAATAPNAMPDTASADDIAAILLRDAHADQARTEQIQEDSSSSLPADTYSQIRQFASQASTLEVISTDTALQVDLTTTIHSTELGSAASAVADALLSTGPFASNDTAANLYAAHEDLVKTTEVISRQALDVVTVSQSSGEDRAAQDISELTPADEPIEGALDKESDSESEVIKPEDEEGMIDEVESTGVHAIPDHDQKLEIDHKMSDDADESEEQAEEVASYLLDVLGQSMGSAGEPEEVSYPAPDGTVDPTQDSPRSSGVGDVPSPTEVSSREQLQEDGADRDESSVQEDLNESRISPPPARTTEVLVSATPAPARQDTQEKDMISMLGDETLRVLEAHADVTVADDVGVIDQGDDELAVQAPMAERKLAEMHEEQILAETPLTRKSNGSRQWTSRRKSAGRKSGVPAGLRGWFSPREDEEAEHEDEVSVLEQKAENIKSTRRTRSQLAFEVGAEFIGRPSNKAEVAVEEEPDEILPDQSVPENIVPDDVVSQEQIQHVELSKRAKQTVRSFENECEVSTGGLHTPLSYFTPLSDISLHLNSQSEHDRNVDILAVVSSFASKPKRATAGPKDHFTTLHVTGPADKGEIVSSTQVQIFRPRKEHLPVADISDVVLLRNFVVRSAKGKCFLLSTASSAWCVWRYSAMGDGQELEKECRGPPVEAGSEEEQRAEELRKWWNTTVRQEESDAEDELSQRGANELGVTGSVTKAKS